MASSGKTSQRAQHLECLAARPSSRDAYCIGSNYIWAWENNKIMREAGYGAGGAVFDAVIEQIINSRPNFVFNTLIGVSAYAFFRGFRRSVETQRDRSAARFPDRQLQPRGARIGRNRTVGLRWACEFKRLFREHQTSSHRTVVASRKLVPRRPMLKPPILRCT